MGRRILLPLLLALPAAAVGAGDRPCANTDCISRQDWKQARRSFEHGLKLHKAGSLAQAFDDFKAAARLDPRNLEYATAREISRQALVVQHLDAGNRLLESDKRVEALAEFRTALQLDPTNRFALERLADSLPTAAPPAALRVETPPQDPQLAPQPGLRDFHLRADSRSLLAGVATAYGLNAVVDDSVAISAVRFDLERADMRTGLDFAARVTHSFWVPISDHDVMFLADTPQMRNEMERVSMRTFYLPQAASPQELNEIATALRGLFDIRFISPSVTNSSLTIRAPTRTLEAATRFMESLTEGKPQVMLDVKVFEVSRSALRQIGIDLPLQFQMFNLPAAALTLGGQNIQDLINQLISSGAINQANSTAIAALLQQLQSQQNSIFQTPFATFGGGISRFGVSMPAATARLAFNSSNVQSLEHVTLRAEQGSAATVRVGSRFPILNAIFSPIFNTSSIAQVIQNNSFQAPFPSFNFEDLGLSLKVTPQAQAGRAVALQLEMQIKALGTQNFNGVPLIANRQYSGTITLEEGEPAVIAGMISRSDQLSLHGVPGLGRVPGAGLLVSSNQKQSDEDELLITITPHILTATPVAQQAIAIGP